MSNNPASLFVGRWQPFHKGHQTLIETVLKKGKPVVVAIRDTELSHKNPYTVRERWEAIQTALNKYGPLVKIIAIPDIDEICYGRDVGYAIRKIELSDKMQAVSGTKTRAKHPPTKKILWLTGQSGAGKSTLAHALKALVPNAVILDGDDMRESISKGVGFSQEDREAHNLRVARLALVLAKQSPVIVSVIAPFEATRKKVDALIKPQWVYVKRSKQKKHAAYPYEVPKKPHATVDMDKQTPAQAAQKLFSFMNKK
jgi:cytidyltransferase-like protein